jgi:hypothetical protein
MKSWRTAQAFVVEIPATWHDGVQVKLMYHLLRQT